MVGSSNRVDIRKVEPGQRVGSLWVIEKGLKPGERVVVEGVQKVHQGMVVKPRQAAKGSSEPEREGGSGEIDAGRIASHLELEETGLRQ